MPKAVRRVVLRHALKECPYLQAYFRILFSDTLWPFSSADAREFKDEVRAGLSRFPVRSLFELLYAMDAGYRRGKRAKREWCALVLRQPKEHRMPLNALLDKRAPGELTREDFAYVLADLF